MKRTSTLIAVVFGVLSLFVWQTGSSIVPDTLRYQGRVTDTLDQPIDGVHHMIFTLYDADKEGNAVWSEGLEINLDDGVFTATLGLTQPFSVGLFDQPLWLGISVDFGEEEGRRPLTSIAFVLDDQAGVRGSVEHKISVTSVGSETQTIVHEQSAPLSVNDTLSQIVAAEPNSGITPLTVSTLTTEQCTRDCLNRLSVHASNPSAHHQNFWTRLNANTIHTTRNFVGINTDPGNVEATLHVRDSGATFPAVFIEGGNNSEGDIAWPSNEHLQLGTWNTATNIFDLKMRLTSNRLVLADNVNMYFSPDTGDRLSLYGNRFNLNSMYGFGISSNTLYYKANGRHAWHIQENADSTPKMALTSTGLGIGTNSPNHELVVQGNNSVVQIRDDVGNNSANAAWLELLERASGSFNGGAYIRWNGETNRLLIGTKLSGVNTNVLVINRSGNNVGIGTQNPGNYRLAVNGSIRAKEIVVESGWSDFVFEPGYDLPSLAEVESHIQEKGHLPDIPSAQEVAEHGVKVGEMESRLLQKVEELTLYLIDMNKRVQSLEVENDRLHQRLSPITEPAG